MNKLAHMSVAAVIILVFLITMIALQKRLYDPTGHLMPVDEAVGLIENRYQGKVISVKQEKSSYQINMERQNKKYLVKMNARNGDVLAIDHSMDSGDTSENISLSEPTESEMHKEIWSDRDYLILKRGKLRATEANFASAADPSTSDQLPGRLNEKEVIQIVKRQVDGRIDSIYFDKNGKVPAYLAKIKTTEGKEVVFQVEANTGEILSVAWDDDEGLEEKEDKKEERKDEDKDEDKDEERKKAEKEKDEDDD